MYNSTYQVDGTNHEDIDRGLVRVGFRRISMGTPIPPSEIAGIVQTLGAEMKDKVMSGLASIIPRQRTEFEKNGDHVVVDSFDIQENETYNPDPVIFVTEAVKGETSSIVLDMLTEEVGKDIIKSALESVSSSKFKLSICDLARLRNESPQQVYEKIIQTLIGGCVTAFKHIEVKEKDLMPHMMQQVIPAGVN